MTNGDSQILRITSDTIAKIHEAFNQITLISTTDTDLLVTNLNYEGDYPIYNQTFLRILLWNNIHFTIPLEPHTFTSELTIEYTPIGIGLYLEQELWGVIRMNKGEIQQSHSLKWLATNEMSYHTKFPNLKYLVGLNIKEESIKIGNSEKSPLKSLIIKNSDSLQSLQLNESLVNLSELHLENLPKLAVIKGKSEVENLKSIHLQNLSELSERTFNLNGLTSGMKLERLHMDFLPNLTTITTQFHSNWEITAKECYGLKGIKINCAKSPNFAELNILNCREIKYVDIEKPISKLRKTLINCMNLRIHDGSEQKNQKYRTIHEIR